jgi:hypothetical protein
MKTTAGLQISYVRVPGPLILLENSRINVSNSVSDNVSAMSHSSECLARMGHCRDIV